MSASVGGDKAVGMGGVKHIDSSGGDVCVSADRDADPGAGKGVGVGTFRGKIVEVSLDVDVGIVVDAGASTAGVSSFLFLPIEGCCVVWAGIIGGDAVLRSFVSYHE